MQNEYILEQKLRAAHTYHLQYVSEGTDLSSVQFINVVVTCKPSGLGRRLTIAVTRNNTGSPAIATGSVKAVAVMEHVGEEAGGWPLSEAFVNCWCRQVPVDTFVDDAMLQILRQSRLSNTAQSIDNDQLFNCFNCSK